MECIGEGYLNLNGSNFRQVEFDLPALCLVHTILKRECKTCDSCNKKGCKHCYIDVLHRAMDSVNIAMSYNPVYKK